MDFTRAIQAHSDWKLRLVAYCRGTSQEGIDTDALVKDNVCELGTWLHGDGRKYSSDSMYSELVRVHAAFHRSAAAIATLVTRGKRADAEALTQSRDSEFNKQSLSVVGILMRFRSRYGENVTSGESKGRI